MIDLDDTNVARFLTCLGLPADQEEYAEGVGTRHSILGQTIGGSIGAGAHARAPFIALREINLYAFANDLENKYDNNSGELWVTVKRH